MVTALTPKNCLKNWGSGNQERERRARQLIWKIREKGEGGVGRINRSRKVEGNEGRSCRKKRSEISQGCESWNQTMRLLNIIANWYVDVD